MARQRKRYLNIDQRIRTPFANINITSYGLYTFLLSCYFMRYYLCYEHLILCHQGRGRERKRRISGKEDRKKVRKAIHRYGGRDKEGEPERWEESKKASYMKHHMSRERERHERYTVRWKLRACWWSRSRTDAHAGGSITSPMI